MKKQEKDIKTAEKILQELGLKIKSEKLSHEEHQNLQNAFRVILKIRAQRAKHKPLT